MADTTKRTFGTEPPLSTQSGFGTAVKEVKEQAKDVASGAAEMANKAKSTAQEWASTAAQKAGDARSAVGEGMESLAGKIKDKAPHGGMVGNAASTIAGQIEAAGSYIREHGLKEMGEDVTGLIRRYPIQSLLIGLGVGFLLARATTSSRS